MKSWRRAFRDGAVSGSTAALSSLAVLLLRGCRDTGRPLAAVNAPSHWLWGRRALRRDGKSWRYTLPGVLIHHGASMFWGVLYERFIAHPGRSPTLGTELRNAAAGTAAAAAVDLLLTPERFTPGFEKRLSATSLLLVYAGFAAGMAIGSRWARRL